MCDLITLLLIIAIVVLIVKKHKKKLDWDETKYINDWYRGNISRDLGKYGVYAFFRSVRFDKLENPNSIVKYGYIIIDFDEHYLYLFGDNQYCERIKLDERENLNKGIVLLDKQDEIIGGSKKIIRFWDKGTANNLVVIDEGIRHKNNSMVYHASPLEETLKLRDEYPIVENLHKTRGY